MVFPIPPEKDFAKKVNINVDFWPRIDELYLLITFSVV